MSAEPLDGALPPARVARLPAEVARGPVVRGTAELGHRHDGVLACRAARPSALAAKVAREGDANTARANSRRRLSAATRPGGDSHAEPRRFKSCCRRSWTPMVTTRGSALRRLEHPAPARGARLDQSDLRAEERTDVVGDGDGQQPATGGSQHGQIDTARVRRARKAASAAVSRARVGDGLQGGGGYRAPWGISALDDESLRVAGGSHWRQRRGSSRHRCRAVRARDPVPTARRSGVRRRWRPRIPGHGPRRSRRARGCPRCVRAGS
jgi:hypothetical protein